MRIVRTVLVGALIVVASFFAVLAFVFPRFVAPLSPFHVDFFDYVSVADVSLRNIVTHYPRPVAFIAMHVLGGFGVTGLIFCETILCLATIVLFWFCIRDGFDGSTSPLQFAIFCVLIFSEQPFYFEYRHDLPFLFEFFFLTCAVAVWMKGPGSRPIVTAVAAASLFVLSSFSKETLYLAGPLFVLSSLDVKRFPRWWTLAGCGGMLAIELAAHVWSVHIGSPFGGNADVNSPYYIDLSPIGAFAREAQYLAAILSPLNVLVIAVFIVASRRRLGALGFVLVGLFAIAPNTVLPNHYFEEYAWVAVPFLFAPVLSNLRFASNRFAIVAAAVLAIVLPVFGSKADANSAWTLHQEALTTNVFRSIGKLDALPADATALIVPPPEAMMAFWHVPSYLGHHFKNDVHLDVLTVGDASVASQDSAIAHFGTLDDFDLAPIRYVFAYADDGTLRRVDRLTSAPCELELAAAIVPTIASWVRGCESAAPNAAAAAELSRALASVGDRSRHDRFAKSAPAREPIVASTSALSASPNPAPISKQSGLATTVVSWKYPAAQNVQVRVSSPNGQLFAAGGSSGSARAPWIRGDVRFYLQDVDRGIPGKTVATMTVSASR